MRSVKIEICSQNDTTLGLRQRSKAEYSVPFSTNTPSLRWEEIESYIIHANYVTWGILTHERKGKENLIYFLVFAKKKMKRKEEEKEENIQL